MKKKIAIVLCITLMLSMIPTATVFGASKMSISPKAMTLAVGDIAQLNVSNAKGKVSWKTSDKSVATVSSKGVVQGKANGTITITAKDSKNKTAKCEVKVENYISDENVLEKLKDKILDFLKQYTYSKSEIDSKISSGSSGGGGGTTVINQCNCKNPTSIDDISLFPNKSVVYKNTPIWNNQELKNDKPTVNFNKSKIVALEERSYDEWLNLENHDGIGYSDIWWRYETSIQYSGTTDPKYAGMYVIAEFAASDERDGWSAGYAKINADGSFSGICKHRGNEIPKELIMVYCAINPYSEEESM